MTTDEQATDVAIAAIVEALAVRNPGALRAIRADMSREDRAELVAAVERVRKRTGRQ
ncbi:hypothetical protein [Nonomuraea dietziae]|uniref:hypothetical protein n=1 Tax=Nonomuraea dietziae TaxID=65515 RepID=UPI00343E4839